MKKRVSGSIFAYMFGLTILVSLIFLSIAIYHTWVPQQSDALLELPASEEPVHIEEENVEDTPSIPVIMERFVDLYEQNNDLVGWIRVPNTVIDYPVVHCSDNEFYLKHDFEKRPSADGIPFLDMGAGILEKNQSLSIYGHYLKNGQMFTALHNYKDLEYYKNYPLFEFHNIYENGFYKIFSVFYMAGNRTDGLFYYYPVSNFNSDAAFMQHVNELLVRSIFITNVDVIPGDQLVLMTCCTYETDNLRLIVAGRKIRPGESFAVNTVNAQLNPEPLFPRKWYDTKGGTPPQLSEH